MHQLLTIIGKRKLKNEIIQDLFKEGCAIINSTYGRSYMSDTNFFVSLGFSPDPEKIIITCLVSPTHVPKIYELLNTKYEFNKKNTGIAFACNINHINI
ncbi:MAG: hypothetical protein LBV55_00800 [Acholeplasmatales bacterium]|jgi:predicted transcriptional regulator|nr:hypothetical protein [Acholeplasmatales bacterium]